MSWKYEEISAWFTSTMLARKTYIQFMLQLMRLTFCPSATQSAKCLSKVPSKAKTNHLRLLRCPSFLLQRGSTWVPSYPLLPPTAIFHDGLSAPHVMPMSPSFCGHSNKQCPHGWHWKHRPFNFSCFSTAKVPHPHVVRLWGSVLHQCSDLLFSVFRRMVTCSTMFFTCQ